MITEIIRLVVAFIVGVFVGRLSHKILKEEDFNGSDLVLSAIVVIWFLSRVVAMIDRSYTSSPVIDGLMGLIAGYFYKNRKEVKDAIKKKLKPKK